MSAITRDRIDAISHSNRTKFNSSIPVIDISQFENTSTRKQFLESLDTALRVGFFGVIHADINVQTIEQGYEAFNTFFSSPKEEKMKLCNPALHGQRGFVPGETAVGNSQADTKEFMHIGPDGNIWPQEDDSLKNRAMALYDELDKVREPLLKGIALLLGQREDFFTTMTHKSPNNLMRALHYPANPPNGLWGGAHTDIDLLTILPYASGEGLEVELNGTWVPVKVPQNAFVINVGDMLEGYSNGMYPSCMHRVQCHTPNVSRNSIVYFVHPTSETPIRNLTDQPARYPQDATRLDWLLLRIFTIGLLPYKDAQNIINGPFVKKIEEMVHANTAAESVKTWYAGYKKTLTVAQKGVDITSDYK